MTFSYHPITGWAPTPKVKKRDSNMITPADQIDFESVLKYDYVSYSTANTNEHVRLTEEKVLFGQVVARRITNLRLSDLSRLKQTLNNCV